MSRTADGLVGAGLATIVGAATVGGIALAPALDRGVTGPELSVSLVAPRPYTVGARAAAVVRPAGISGRLEQRGEPSGTGPGIWWQTWRTTYARRWTREVVVPSVQGPLRRPDDGACGFALRVQPELLDTRRSPALERLVRERAQRAIDELNRELDARQRDSLVTWTSYRFGTVKGVRMRAASDADAIRLTAAVDFGDARRFDLDLRVAVRAEQGALKFEAATGSTLELSPSLRADLLGRVQDDHDLLCGPLLDWLTSCTGRVDAAIRTQGRVATAKLASELSALALKLKQTPSPLPGRPGDKLTLTVTDARADRDGVSASFCVGATLGAPVEDSTLEGFPYFASSPPRLARRRATDPPGAQLAVNLDGLNLLLFIGWQAGALGALGRSPAVRDALPAATRQLAFDVSELSPRLPPQLAVHQAGAWRLVVPSVKLGTWDLRDVVGHADLGLRALGTGSRLQLTAAIESVALDCEHRAGDAWLFTPCLSDLLPAIRDTISGSSRTVSVDLGDALSGFAGRALDGARVDAASATLGHDQLDLAIQLAP